MKLGVIIPTYNEIENIEKLIDRIYSVDVSGHLVHVIVVDDNSPDSTAQRVKDIQRKCSNVHLIERSGKMGLASAYIGTIQHLLKEDDYDAFVTMDADFSHDPKNIVPMMKALEAGNDVVIGSRYIRGGSVKNWPLKRKYLSFFGNVYASLIVHAGIRDMTSGHVMMRSSFLKKINLDKISASGYAFLMEMKFMFFLRDARIKEIPIVFVDRVHGVSKISSNIIKEGMMMPWKLRMNVKKYKKP